jgi:hypothetical protein
MTNKKGFWEIKIRKVNNGYICSWEEESENQEDYFKKEQKVFEEIDDDELKNMREMLLFIKEYFGINYSKHNKKNLVVEIENENSNEE